MPGDRRSCRFVFVPYCLLAQGVRAQGIVRHYPAIVHEIVDWLQQHNINIHQMDCPELHFDRIIRPPCGKPRYDKPENRQVCRQVAIRVVERILQLRQGGHEVEAIFGIDFSPSCGVKLLTGPPPNRRRPGKGIYTEELSRVLRERNLKIPFIGVEIYNIQATLQEMEQLLGRRG